MTVGKTLSRKIPRVKTFEKELKPPNRLVGLHGIKNVRKGFNLDRLGIITAGTDCINIMNPDPVYATPEVLSPTSILLITIGCIVFIVLFFIFCVIRNLKAANSELVEID